MVKFVPVVSEEELSQIRDLFKEYASTLGFDLDFQNFEEELAELPGEYSPPNGCLLLAKTETEIVGCVALRKLTEEICEMKRLYIRPKFRGKGIGRDLALVIIKEAREIGYNIMRLDTISSMKEATALYYSLGFKKIEPYRFNPIENAIFLELDL